MAQFMSKTLLFLSFLLAPSLLHCMNMTATTKTVSKNFKIAKKAAQNIKPNFNLNPAEDRIKRAIDLARKDPIIANALIYESHKNFIDNYPVIMAGYKDKTFNGYSILAFAAIAISVDLYKQDKFYAPKYAPYKDRKKLVKFLLKQGIQPTQEDFSLAFYIEKEAGLIRTSRNSDLLDE